MGGVVGLSNFVQIAHRQFLQFVLAPRPPLIGHPFLLSCSRIESSGLVNGETCHLYSVACAVRHWCGLSHSLGCRKQFIDEVICDAWIQLDIAPKSCILGRSLQGFFPGLWVENAGLGVEDPFSVPLPETAQALCQDLLRGIHQWQAGAGLHETPMVRNLK